MILVSRKNKLWLFICFLFKFRNTILFFLTISVFFVLQTITSGIYLPFSDNKKLHSIFFISRNCILLDPSQFDLIKNSQLISNSIDIKNSFYNVGGCNLLNRTKENEKRIVKYYFDDKSFVNSIEEPLIKRDSDSIVYPHEEFNHFVIEEINTKTGQKCSQELLFNFPQTSFVEFELSISDKLILFSKKSFFPAFNINDNECNNSNIAIFDNYKYIQKNEEDNIFWYVKQDNFWVKKIVKLPFNDYVEIKEWEIISDKNEILLILYSPSKDKAYVVLYNYETFLLEKVNEIPFDSDASETKIRVINGEENFFVYKYLDFEKESPTGLECIVYALSNLKIIKKIKITDIKKIEQDDPVIISPNLRYIVFGSNNVYLFDSEYYSVKHIWSSNEIIRERVLQEGFRSIRSLSEIRYYAEISSIAFSNNSEVFVGTNYLGDVFYWDVSSKKRIKRISTLK